MGKKTGYLGYAYGLRDAKGNTADDKDIGRIMDIVDKADGEDNKILQLVERMARSITKQDKAMRRADACNKVLPKRLRKKAQEYFLSKFKLSA